MGLYPSVASANLFPMGKPKIFITKEELNNLKFKDGLCYLDRDNQLVHVNGVIQLKIVAPQNLKIPFLQFR